MNKFSNNLKKPCFWPILGPFSYFLGQKKFSWKIQLCHTQLHMGFQHHAKIQKKLMIQFKENTQTDGRTEGWKDNRKDRRTDRQTLFYRTLPATAGGPVTGFYMKHNGGRKWVNLRGNIGSYIISPSSRRYKIKKIIWAQNFSHNFIVAQKRIGKASRICLFCSNSL